MIKCALADINKVPALVLQTEDLYFSGKLLMCESAEIIPIIAMVGTDDDKVYFLIYDKKGGVEDPLFVKQAEQQDIDFVKKVKEDETWVLVLQVVIFCTHESEKLPYTLITLRNIDDGVNVREPIVKEDWVIIL